MKSKQFVRAVRVEFSRKLRLIFFAMAVLGWAVPISRAAILPDLVINVGDFILAPNTPNQSFSIFIQNTGGTTYNVGGFSFNLQVTSDNTLNTPAPAITAVDIITGTVFAGLGTQTTVASVPHFWNVNFTVPPSPGTVALVAGMTTKIASFTLDTTGFFTPMTWDLNVGDTINGQTKYFDSVGNDIFPTIIDGTIAVVPEPALMSCVAAFLCITVSAFGVFKSRRHPSKA
jgi:hypothetical protein